MANERFGTEYEAQRILLQTATLAGSVAGILDLKKVLHASGPDRNHASALDNFRNIALKFKQGERIMEASDMSPTGTGAPSEASVEKAGLLKFLRHLYLVGERGSQQVWVLSTPAAYRNFPRDELLSAKTSHSAVKAKLDDVIEKFDVDTRKRFGEATQLGLAWIEAAKAVLASASSDTNSMAKIKRWFASSATPATDLNATIASVLAGFKKMANSLNSNLVVITDLPQKRNDPNQEYTEAFMYSIGAAAESPRTIYIEQALFHNFDISVLHDMKKNWTRVIVHECSHIDGRTADKAYAHSGIGVGTHITAAEAAVNADSWAFFAADCGGALTDGDILRAKGGTSGTLTRLAANWN
jgi:hypothetical protein